MYYEPLVTNPFNLERLDTEGMRRLVKYLKLHKNPETQTRKELIDILRWHGLIKLKFKLGWQ